MDNLMRRTLNKNEPSIITEDFEVTFGEVLPPEDNNFIVDDKDKPELYYVIRDKQSSDFFGLPVPYREDESLVEHLERAVQRTRRIFGEVDPEEDGVLETALVESKQKMAERISTIIEQIDNLE